MGSIIEFKWKLYFNLYIIPKKYTVLLNYLFSAAVLRATLQKIYDF